MAAGDWRLRDLAARSAALLLSVWLSPMARAAEVPAPDQWDVHLLRACFFVGDATRAGFASSAVGADFAEAAEAGLREEDNPSNLVTTYADMRKELETFSPLDQVCGICQVLGECASQLAELPPAPDLTAHQLTWIGLGLYSVSEPDELIPSVRASLPPRGGPNLAQGLARACTRCTKRTGSAKKRVDPAPLLEACQELDLAWHRFRVSYHLAAESAPPGPRPSPASDCAALQRCAVDFAQAGWVDGSAMGGMEDPPTEGLLAGALDRATAARIRRARRSVELAASMELQLAPEDWVASTRPPRAGVPTLWRALRQECVALHPNGG